GEVTAQGVLGVPQFQLERVAAENLAAEGLFGSTLERFVDPVRRRFTPADEAGVGFQADEDRFFCGGGAVARLVRGDGWFLRDANDHGVQLCDFHARNLTARKGKGNKKVVPGRGPSAMPGLENGGPSGRRQKGGAWRRVPGRCPGLKNGGPSGRKEAPKGRQFDSPENGGPPGR